MKAFKILAFAMLFVLLAASAASAERMLTPNASSPTAMVKCGAEIEKVKTQIGATRRYVFTGQEVLTGMRYCIRESNTDVVDARNEYRVPSGTVGWLAPDGRIVLEGCVNDATCKGCLPAPAAAAELPPRPEPPTLRAVAVEAQPLKILAQYLWLRDDHTTQLAFSNTKTGEYGRNSRSIGAKLFDKHGKPTSPLYTPCQEVPFEFLNVYFVKARGKTVWINGVTAKIPDDFSAGKSAINIRVCKGLGEIGFGSDWDEWIDKKKSVLRLHGDGFLDKLVYPIKERPWLETCTKEADSLRKCGRVWDNEVGELYQLLAEHDRSRFHMKVRE